MLDAIFATKLGMTQAWSKSGKRLAVTKCRADDNLIVGQRTTTVTDKSSRTWNAQPHTLLEVGFGAKKQSNMKKPLRERLKKSGFSFGVKQIKGVRYEVPNESPLTTGDFVSLSQVLSVGDVVKVQGVSKGRGFAGAMKRHGFHGGPATHGQSDRERAVGSIGAGTTPGRVWKGKKMPGHYGVETKTVHGLIVLHIDPETKELWLSGPVPGFNTSIIKIQKTGEKRPVELNVASLGLVEETGVEENQAGEETVTEAEAASESTVEQNSAAQEAQSTTEEVPAQETSEAPKEEVAPPAADAETPNEA